MRRIKCSGFTILESVLTLAVSCMLIMIGSVRMDSYENHLVLVNTERQVKTAIEQVARISTIKHERINVAYFEDQSYIQFKGNSYTRKLTLDKRVKLSGTTRFYISDNGSMSPRTITFSNGKNTKNLKLQMMWGRAIDD